MRPKGAHARPWGLGFGSLLACCFNADLSSKFLTSTSLNAAKYLTAAKREGLPVYPRPFGLAQGDMGCVLGVTKRPPRHSPV